MKKQKLNYRFHNPNTAEITADILIEVFVEANSKKVAKAVQEAAEQFCSNKECDEGHLA